MEIKKVKYFLRIVDEGSISRAAASLYLTQPTLSRFLANLEEELGTKLFTRGRDNSLKLTLSGEIYLETARKIDALQRELDVNLGKLGGMAGDKILLGVDADCLLSFAGECADAVNSRYPHICVEILRKESWEMQQLVKNGALDLAVTAYESTDSDLTYIPVRRCPVDLIVGLRNPLAQFSYQRPGQENLKISIKDLDAATPFALLWEGTVLRRLEDALLSQMEQKPRIVRTYMRQCTGMELVAGSTDMVSFCPRGNQAEGVACLALEPVYYYTKGICYAKNAAAAPERQFLIQLLQKVPENLDMYS